MQRSRRGDDDGGFALIFVLLVTMIVMAAVATTLAVTTPDIANASNTSDTAAALLAAQSGVDDAVAYLTSVSSCRSETRVCPQALGADSATLNRPSLGNHESFHWTTASSTVGAAQYVRVTSTGTVHSTSRTVVADLSLNPSILSYGYYSNYESQTPAFFNGFYGPRSVDIANSTTYGQISSSYSRNASAPQTVSWNGAGVNPPANYSDAVCAQHWYSDGVNSPGRAAAAQKQNSSQALWEESGTFNGHSLTDQGSCDLVFTAGMTENGPTYTRDAIDIANGSGSGPVFNQPVYTLWGYGSHTTPTPSATQPWRMSDGAGKDTLPNSPYKPQVGTQDITLPTTIGTDGIESNSCVYFGPTRVVLNGDGTATVTSPATTSIPSGADAGCYPNSVSGGILDYTYNYTTTGSGTIYVKNLNTPAGGTWPVSTLKSTTTPSADNEIFYYPTADAGAANPNKTNTSATPTSGCSSTTKYAATVGATCAWTNVATNTDATSSTGWTAYGTTTKCNATIAATDRELFECEYSQDTGASLPTSNRYGTVRGLIQSDVNAGSCLSGTTSAQGTCLATLADNRLATANTSGLPYNSTSFANGSHRYVATATVGSPTTTNQALGSQPSNPTAGDSFFTYSGSAAQETEVQTPITITVTRQTKSSGSWSSGTAQFTFTVTQTAWSYTPASGASYFPNPQDVTQYATGATSSGTAAGSTGTSQPGDLYVQGVNQGTLSLVAQNNVEVTGNITKGAGQDSSATNPVSITAGNDIRNYHPVSCVDQTAADINATTAGWCPNDLTGVPTSSTMLNSDGSYTAQFPAAQYTNINGTGDRTIDAALFTLTGSLRTDNYDRGVYVGNLNVNGGIYEDYRGANGVTFGNGNGTPGHAGTSLNYTYVDLERANLQYVPSASYSANPRVWNVVSISQGS